MVAPLDQLKESLDSIDGLDSVVADFVQAWETAATNSARSLQARQSDKWRQKQEALESPPQDQSL